MYYAVCMKKKRSVIEFDQNSIEFVQFIENLIRKNQIILDSLSDYDKGSKDISIVKLCELLPGIRLSGSN